MAGKLHEQAISDYHRAMAGDLVEIDFKNTDGTILSESYALSLIVAVHINQLIKIINRVANSTSENSNSPITGSAKKIDSNESLSWVIRRNDYH